MDNVSSSGLTALYVGRILLPHRAVKKRQDTAIS